MATRLGRQKCYLCDLPHSPWAVLTDFSEVVCRGCCNYEGADRVEEVIQAARTMRRAHAHETFKMTANGTTSDTASDASMQVPVTRSSIPVDYRHETVVLPNSAHAVMDRGHPNLYSKRMAASSHNQEGTLDGLPSPSAAAAGSHVYNCSLVRSPHSLVRDTLAILNKCVPFNVRFTKDRYLLGRIFAFDAIVRGNGEYEIKAYVEYPPGSNNVYQSASGASKQMYTEYRERMGVSSPRQGAASNGYKDLEFERVPGDWRLLGTLLTEAARYFRAPINPELLPVPYLDPACPSIPSPFGRGSSVGIGRKRSEDMAVGEAPESKMARANEGRSSAGSGQDISSSQGVNIGHRSPSATDIAKNTPSSNLSREQSPNSVREIGNQTSSSPTNIPNLVPACYSSRMPVHHSNKAFSPSASTPAAPLQCLLCLCPLQDTRFVQCPSVSQHKFCFACSREAIINAQRDGTDVFCPSGHRCPVVGSTMPWAFMQAEIETIVTTGIGNLKKET
ncbi:probable E3 ubiquitin-protein ligase IRF2BPL [Corticium candelabrum]|uniref:probable E3 ubiquitin-protein ligase IRF2BPL n=1 Tax=Corticium candelabrum TaxID=121492 RepID=UPI002E275E57|nr:probable E3 ubiquitin-protein ligase IRF2BPL [Corticium candelabrum]